MPKRIVALLNQDEDIKVGDWVERLNYQHCDAKVGDKRQVEKVWDDGAIKVNTGYNWNKENFRKTTPLKK